MSTFCSEDDAPLGPPEVTDAPVSIWLNVGEIDDDCSFDDLDADNDGVTWCSQRQFQADIQYIRAELVREVLPANWAEDVDWHIIAKALGLKVPA